MEAIPKPEIWTLSEAAKQIDGLTEYRLREMCKNGEIPCIKAGRKYLVNKIALYRHLNGDGFVAKSQAEQTGFGGIMPIKP